MSAKVLLRRGGTLDYHHWDAESESWATVEATDWAGGHLFTHCELEDGVVLRDILLLMQRDIETWDRILGYWCRELVAEGLSGPSDEAADRLERLDLFWELHCGGEDGELWGLRFPAFDGWGVYDDGCSPAPVVGRVGIMGCPVNRLAHLPVRLCQEVEIRVESAQGGAEEIIRTKKCHYTLGQVLQGIIWELSWFGPPEERDEFTVDD